MKKFNFFFSLAQPIRFLSFRVSLSLLIGGLSAFFCWLVYTATSVVLPSIKSPLIFYSNQTRDDIKAVLCQLIKAAKSHVYLSIYGLTDTSLIHILDQKSLNIPVDIYYDSSASSKLRKKLPYVRSLYPIKTKGLMHRKLLIVDQELIFFGSANFTPSSLMFHSNLIIGLHHPQLAKFFQNSTDSYYSFEIQGQEAEIFLLPKAAKEALARILHLINQAKKTINVAMFTLTHPHICNALIEAKKRNVQVTVISDGYSAKGASKKALEQLKNQGIAVYTSQGAHLLHHKLCVIDQKTLITGSANWTQAAFSKNADLLFILNIKDAKLKIFLKRLCKVIKIEAKLASSISCYPSSSILTNDSFTVLYPSVI